MVAPLYCALRWRVESVLSLEIKINISLLSSNTFGLDVTARLYCRVTSLEMLREALRYARNNVHEVLILGGGSNVVFVGDFDGLVIAVDIRGIAFNQNQVTVMAGEVWHNFVNQTLAQGLSGLENLSLIPGLVGAAPIQNIGAYGVELAERLSEVKVMDRRTGIVSALNRQDCDFGYRDSIFKHSLRDKVVVVSITLQLDEHFIPRLTYSDLDHYFRGGDVAPSARQVANAVVEIRLKKLPDPVKIGNVGSFFKNPEVSYEKWIQVRQTCPELDSIRLENGNHKLSAATLISNCWSSARPTSLLHSFSSSIPIIKPLPRISLTPAIPFNELEN